MAQLQVVLAVLFVSQVLGGFIDGHSQLTKPFYPPQISNLVGVIPPDFPHKQPLDFHSQLTKPFYPPQMSNLVGVLPPDFPHKQPLDGHSQLTKPFYPPQMSNRVGVIPPDFPHKQPQIPHFQSHLLANQKLHHHMNQGHVQNLPQPMMQRSLGGKLGNDMTKFDDIVVVTSTGEFKSFETLTLEELFGLEEIILQQLLLNKTVKLDNILATMGHHNMQF